MTSTGYAVNYANYTNGWITPEYGFWKEMNDVQVLNPDDFADAMADTYLNMTIEYFFNRVVFSNTINEPSTLPAVFPSMDKYFRALTINYGLTSLLQKRTPRQMIEGYTAPIYEQLNSLDLVKGGDKTIEPFLALSELPTRPLDNKIALFTGQNQYNMTRTYGKWMD